MESPYYRPSEFITGAQPTSPNESRQKPDLVLPGTLLGGAVIIIAGVSLAHWADVRQAGLPQVDMAAEAVVVERQHIPETAAVAGDGRGSAGMAGNPETWIVTVEQCRQQQKCARKAITVTEAEFDASQVGTSVVPGQLAD